MWIASIQVPQADVTAAEPQLLARPALERSASPPPLFVAPDLTTVGSKVKNSPDDRRTHPLDMVPKEDTDLNTLSVRQLLILLQQTGLVAQADGTKSSRGISPHAALEAVRLSCFPQRANENVCLSQPGTWGQLVRQLAKGRRPRGERPDPTMRGFRRRLHAGAGTSRRSIY